MSKRDQSMKMQTCVLKVNIQCRCDGCKKKIKKMIQKTDGVHATTVDAEQGKVSVTGNVDPAKLIKKLEKSGKHAQLWGVQKSSNNHQNFLNNQFKNMQIDFGKSSGEDNYKSQKGGNGQQKQQQMQQVKRSKDSKKDQKSVKFNLDEDDFEDDDEFYDEFDDEFDEDLDDEEDDFGHGHGHSHGNHHLPNKMMPMMGPNGPHGMINMNQATFDFKRGGGGGNFKKGGDFEIPMVIKGKNGNGGKEGGVGGADVKNGNSNGKGRDKKQDGKDKSGGKSVGGFLGFGRKSKNGREDSDQKSNNKKNGGNGNNNNGNGAKKGGKDEWAHEINKTKQQGYHSNDGYGNSGAKNMGQMGQIGPMGKMGPKGPPMAMGGYYGGGTGSMGGPGYGGMGNPHAVQGLPVAMNGGGGGFYQGVNPYNQQYMAMMMNQQRAYGNDMFHPMMYARPHPAVNHVPPSMPPPHTIDYTHLFSDENTKSCTIM